MNMLAYEVDTAWNRVIPCFFKTLIQLYFLRSFRYSLTYCIKKGIEDNILEKILKVLAYEADTACKRGIPCIFFKTLVKSYVFCVLIIWSTVS